VVGAAGVANKAIAASIVACWESSRDFTARASQIRAEAAVNRVPKLLGTTERQAMKRAVETSWGKIPKNEMPSTDYLSAKLEEVEHEDPQASPLDEVCMSEASQAQAFNCGFDISGRVIITRQRQKGKMPTSSEELQAMVAVTKDAELKRSTSLHQ